MTKFESVTKYDPDGNYNPRYIERPGYTGFHQLHAKSEIEGEEPTLIAGADRHGSLPAVAEFMNNPGSIDAARLIINLQPNEIRSFMAAHAKAFEFLSTTEAPAAAVTDLADIPVEPGSHYPQYCKEHDDAGAIDPRSSFVYMTPEEAKDALHS